MTDSATHPYAFVTIKHALQSSINSGKHTINSDDVIYDDDEFPTSIAPSNASCSSSSSSHGSSLGASTSMISLADSVDSSNDSSELSHDDTDDGYNTPDDDDIRRINNAGKLKTDIKTDAIIDFPTPVIASGGLDAGLDAECIFMTGSADYHDHTGANLGTKSAIAKLLAESATATSIVNVSNETTKTADDAGDDEIIAKSHVATPVTAIAKPAPAVVAPAAEPANATRLINTTKYAITKKQNPAQSLGKHRFNVGTRYRV